MFPLIGITPDGKCACGNPECARVGKHPAVMWGEITAENMAELSHRPAPGAGYGVKTGAAPKGSGVVVVDCDGAEALERWQALCGGAKPVTYEVETGRGWQWYFQHPGFPVKNSAGELSKGIDIRGDGGFVVGAGSPHRNGKTYAVTCDYHPQPAPPWLLDWLRARSTPDAPAQSAPAVVTDTDDLAYVRFLFTDHCKKIPPADEGKRHAALFAPVQHGVLDLGLPDVDVLAIIAEHYNPRCAPPMPANELQASVRGHCRGARERSTRPRNEPLPRDLAHLALPACGSSANENVLIPPAVTSETGGLIARWGGWDAPVAPPVYILEGLIPEHKVVTFFAEGGSLKTWAALSLAIATARGEPWLGIYGVKKAPALYLDWEDGPYEFSRRVRMLTQGIDVPDLGYLYGGPQIDKADFWIALARTCQARGIGLVVCDSLGAAMPGDAEENDTRFSVGVKLAGRCTEIGVTVAFVHHANKSGSIRGTSAIRDQSDVVFGFEPVSDTDDVKRMRMVCDKPGPQKRPKPVNIELSDRGVRAFDDAAQSRPAFVRTGDAEKDIVAAVGSAVMGHKELKKLVGGSAERFDDTLKRLAAEGRIVNRDAGYRLDSPELRRARVLSCLVRADEVFCTPSDLAKAAHVQTADVDTLIRTGFVHRSAEGRMAWTNRP